MAYPLNHELKINKLAKEKVNELHDLLHDKKSMLSDRQRENALRELKECQEILFQNRLHRQLETR
ncbi:hypothetical protein [Enterococcus gallinarum]|uniref:hypothetical protein n=1 Tax=Enterococcus gallinarum TaxID=1353 RepID=UPI001AD66F8B|nr:hypothetical protein [Enterococcus gallinarum]MBO6419914.1 hypothetical protein [Enterococcus gallinarum]MBO6423566.1 hypothetical protein [Enterococcus gallinarum]